MIARCARSLVIATAILLLNACSEPVTETPPDGLHRVAVIGAIHGQHKNSERYSLEVLEQAIIAFDPDIVMVELPADRLDTASANYQQFGEVREARADDFPELTDMLFPLHKKLGFEMVGVAAWSPEIAERRRETLKSVSDDPALADDWAQFQAARKAFRGKLSGRADDPLFIHSADYDAAARARQETYERLFGEELGSGGWQAINAAHFALIDRALDRVEGEEKRILILFGALHKYWFLDALDARNDLFIIDSAALFKD